MKSLFPRLWVLALFGCASLSYAGPIGPAVPLTGVGAGTYTASGYSSRFATPFNISSVSDALNQLFGFAYSAPQITLTSSPGPEVLEDSTPISSVGLSAFTVKTSSAIVQVTFYRDGSLIHTTSSPPSSGGTSTFTDGPINSTTTYTAQVTDHVSTTTSNSQTITYVYPFFYGVGAQSLNMSQIASLTKSVQGKQNTATTTSPTAQVYYFAYPAAYGNLTSILDPNGFETVGGYTKHTYTYSARDGTNQSYFAYEFNTVTTQSGFTNTYKF